MTIVRLTTVDNPFDPFSQFDEWNSFDIEKGYNTCELLGRVAKTSPNLSDYENNELTLEACQDIIRLGINPNYTIATLEVE